MSLVFDVTADQPPATGQLAVQELTPEEVASLAEASYQFPLDVVK